jgi:hypothetical protein
MFQFFIIKGILLLIYHFKIFCNKYIVVSFDHIQGPYLHKTKTHLQRVLGDENVLAVKFAEEVAAWQAGESFPVTIILCTIRLQEKGFVLVPVVIFFLVSYSLCHL